MPVRTPFNVRARLAALFVAFSAVAAADEPLHEARDLAAQAKILRLDAGNALSQGDREAWESKSDDALGLLRDAARLYRAAGVDSSEELPLVAEYAEVLELAGDFDLAADVYAHAVELDPTEPEWRLKRGIALSHMGATARRDAIQSLRYALELEAGEAIDAQAAAALGNLYWDAGHCDLAERYAARAVQIDSANVAAAGTLAAAQIRRGDVTDAVQTLSALRAFRGDEFAELQAKLAQALREFDQNGAWFDDTAANHLAFAQVLLRVNRYADAALALKRAVTLVPQDVNALNLLGAVLQQVGDTAGARAALERSLDVNPDQPSIREALDELG